MQFDTDPKYLKQLRAALISGDPRNLIRLAQNTGRTKLFTQDVERAEVVMHKLRATLPDMPLDVQMQSKIWLATHGLQTKISDQTFDRLKGPKL